MDLTIATSASVSNALDNPKGAYNNLVLYGAASYAGAITVMVSPKRSEESASGDYIALQSGGTDVTLTAAKATPLTVAGFGSLRLATDTPPGAPEVTPVTGMSNKS